MSIKFLNLDQETSTVRPTGYKYPLGLTTFLIPANVATNITGGVQTMDGDNAVHTYTTSGFFDNQTGSEILVEYLIVAGGGAGGSYAAGGGGAGGYRYAYGHPVPSSNVTVTVGAGGTPTSSGTPGGNGVNSVFDTITSLGGGGGGSLAGAGNGKGGGSGGGAAHENSPAGLGTPGQGLDGGRGGAHGMGGGGGRGGWGKCLI